MRLFSSYISYNLFRRELRGLAHRSESGKEYWRFAGIFVPRIVQAKDDKISNLGKYRLVNLME